ncbi:MAG: hypothetical protein LBM18_03465 [Oscillospiraceae bacterium]|jgi:hypothetical protein|nr:hypothetical protein [Oscillospiraceae bacterium]
MEGKKKFLTDDRLELIVVIMLGLTALLTAWASWIGALHGGNQATNYARSNNLASEANSEYNVAIQAISSDMMIYNEINSLQLDMMWLKAYGGDESEIDRLQEKQDELFAGNVDEHFAAAIDWAWAHYDETGEIVSPFSMEGFTDSYFTTYHELIAESEATLAQGQADNKNDDTFGLVTVIYSVVLFLYGIVSSFGNMRNKQLVCIIAGVAFLVATVLMMTLPLPDGFSISSFFG